MSIASVSSPTTSYQDPSSYDQQITSMDSDEQKQLDDLNNQLVQNSCNEMSSDVKNQAANQKKLDDEQNQENGI